GCDTIKRSTRSPMENTAKPTLTSVTVAQAWDAIMAHFAPLEPVSVPLPEALGLVLAEDVSSDLDLPPFDNSAMDGYAVQASDTIGALLAAPISLHVVGYILAGAAPGPDDVVRPGTAI